jgi:eukaryotic-like serine/threonine-protein kinase
MSDPRVLQAKSRVGTVLRGKWRLDSLIGIGAMAAVFAATHRNGKRVAVKMLHPEMAADADVRTRFLREGYAANRIEHHGCVSVLDDDTAEDGSVYLVMELLHGETLQARALRRGGKLPVAELVALADQLLDVLAAAHDKGIIHRDIKPENLFVTREGALKVLDFGIARIAENRIASTMAGAAMGTPAFMPPEQALAQWDKLDARADLWSAGATMWNLATGRMVHVADSVTALLVAISTKPVAPILSVQPDLPPPIAAVIDRALALEPTDRWPDARSMQGALRAAATMLPEAGPDGVVPISLAARRSFSTLPSSESRPSLPPSGTMFGSSSPVPAPKSSHLVLPVVAGVLTLLVGAAALVLLFRSPPAGPPPAGDQPSVTTSATTAPNATTATTATTTTASASATDPTSSAASAQPSAPQAPTASPATSATPTASAPEGTTPATVVPSSNVVAPPVKPPPNRQTPTGSSTAKKRHPDDQLSKFD